MGLPRRTLLRPGSAPALRGAAFLLLFGLPGAPSRAQSLAPGLQGPAPASPARGWTLRPVFTLGGGYDSNIAYTPTGFVSDYFASLGVRAPFSGRLSQNSTITGTYGVDAEWYRERSAFDAVPSRQDASLAWSARAGEAWTLGLNAGYNESRRPEDVFPETGAGYLRGKTSNLAAGATVGRRLSERNRFEVGYTYGRPFYETFVGRLTQEATNHTGQASLGRQFGRTTSLDLRYTYQLYLREGLEDDTSHVVGLQYKTGLGRQASLNLFAGARLQEGDVQPDLSITLGRAWRSSRLSLGYIRTRNFVPTTEGFTDTDLAQLSWTYERRKFQFSLAGGYSRNALEGTSDLVLGQDYEAWQGTLNTVYMLKRWLGLGVMYLYHWQKSDDLQFLERTRHVARVGLTLSPWSDDNKPQGLR